MIRINDLPQPVIARVHGIWTGSLHLMLVAIACQVLLLGYHQTTTLIDLHPFNGVHHHTSRERFTEAAVNGVLMLLPIIGFVLRLHGLMLFGVIYYFILLFFELVIWWVPYFTDPSPVWRPLYNVALAVATSNFQKGDTLESWASIHHRLHDDTITPLRSGAGPIRPNLEHIILHAWTLVTALATVAAYSGFHH